MYENPVVLNREQHAGLTISPSPNGYHFAAGLVSAMLAVGEFVEASKVYPIVFTDAPEGRILPVALLGLEENENLFVGEDGTWDAPYVPAYVRRYPFVTTSPDDDRMAICFDETYDGFNLEGGVPLFDSADNDTEKMQEISRFLQEYYQEMRLSENLADKLRLLGLLDRTALQVRSNDGAEYNLQDIQVVNEARFAELDDHTVVELFRTGQMWLVMLHLASLRNTARLLDRKVEKTRANAEALS